MNPDPAAQAAPLMGYSVLVVDPSMPDLLFAVEALSSEGFQVSAAETFEQAKALLVRDTPQVLLTAIRLGEYNGLHLVLRGKAERPDLAAVVTCPSVDAVLLAEADAMKATFVVTPTSREELVAAVLRTLFKSADSSDPIRPPFDRRHDERRLTALDVAIDRRCAHERRRNRGALQTVVASLGHDR